MQDVDPVNVPGAEASIVELDDGALLALARDGHPEAYAALFTRYSYAAHRLARHLGQKEDSDDVVSESFAQVLALVRRGKGPDRAFRAYLFTTIRHEAARRAKARQRVMPTDDVEQIDQSVPFGQGQLDGFERAAIRAAYESLPARWRTVLWHLDVEGRKPQELGPLLDLSPNSVSALVYRARSGLREAYLQQHVKVGDPGGSRTCCDVRAKLSAFVRRTASARDHTAIHGHLETCRECLSIYLDLQEINREVGATVAPAALAASATGVGAAAVLGGGAPALVAHGAALAKWLLAVLAPTATAAALTSATIVGGAGAELHDPARRPAHAAPVQDRVAAPATTPAAVARPSAPPRAPAPAALTAPAPAAAAPHRVVVRAEAALSVPATQPAAPASPAARAKPLAAPPPTPATVPSGQLPGTPPVQATEVMPPAVATPVGDVDEAVTQLAAPPSQ